MELREYQERMIESAREELRNGKRRIILHAATGSGKTVIAAAIVAAALEKGKRVLFLVHLRQLAFQAMERFTEWGIGDQVGIIMAGEESYLGRPVQVASVQTYGRRLDFDDKESNDWFIDADLVIYDECHSSIARTRKQILELYKDSAIIIGLTATPCRADSRGLGEVYESIVSCTGIDELTENKFLVPAVYYGCEELPDLKNIPEVAGDYNKKILGERVDKPKLVGDIYDNWVRIANDRQTVIFATNVKHSKHIRDLFGKNGIAIEHIDAHSPDEDRKDVLDRFRRGGLQCVTNVGVYSEGADFPWASCIVLAKPSKSYARYVQMAGRGLRPYEGKEDCILIDHAGLVNRHGFLDEEVVWSLDGKEKAWKKVKPRKKEKKIMECDECRFQFAGPKCPMCGTPVPDWGKKIETTDHELEQIGKHAKKKATLWEKQRFYGMLEFERQKRGYAEGWTAHNYKKKFGVWPRGLNRNSCIPPDAEFDRWLRNQFRQYFLLKKKREEREGIAL